MGYAGSMIKPDNNQKSPEPSYMAIVAHELGTPLSSLELRLHLLRQHPERLNEQLDVLDRTVAHLSALLQDLLDISSLEGGMFTLNPQPVPLDKLVTMVVQLLNVEAEQKSIPLITDLPLDSLIVLADADRLIQVLTNLVKNAIHYTPNGGRVTIRATAIDHTSALIQVNDTGIGISPQNLPYVFEPFFRVDRNKKGTGLGLGIAKQIVELHDSELLVESEIAEGTTFSFMLRLAE